MPIDKVQTLSIVAGTMRCNARCPDCVSKMTTDPADYKIFNFKDVEWDHLDQAVDMALKGGIRAILFTGKGEETLSPKQINDYLEYFLDRVPDEVSRELQTNGLIFQDPEYCGENGWLKKWHENRLDTICLSVVDIDGEVNHAFYNPHQEKYPSLDKTIEMLHDIGYNIRLSITMTKGRVDSPDDIERVVEYCKERNIEQLSVRPVRKPTGDTFCPKVARWVEENQLTKEQENRIVEYVEANKDKVVERLMHGAVVYQFRGQNLCLTDCLTHRPDEPGCRQLIFYSNGMLTDGWTEEANTILDIGPKCRAYLKEK